MNRKIEQLIVLMQQIEEEDYEPQFIGGSDVPICGGYE